MSVRAVSVATIWCLLLLAGPVAAQDTSVTSRYLDPAAGLTVAQAIAEGLRQEPGLREARSGADAVRGDRSQAGLRFNPLLSAERREQVGGMDNQTMVGVELPLDLFRRRARMAVADRVVTVMERSADDRARLLTADIRERMGVSLAAVRRLEILESLVDASQRTLALLDARVREGAVPPLDRDVVSVELQRLRANRELAIGQADAALATLKPLLGLPGQFMLKLGQSLEAAVASDMPVLLATPASATRADVLEAEARLAAANARMTQVRQEAKPDLGVFASYVRMDSSFPQQGVGLGGALEPIHGIFHYAAGGVRLTLPVFNRNQGALVAARAQSEAAAHGLDARRLAVEAEVAAATARDAAARRALALYSTDARALARRNLDVVRETYQLGRVTLFDVLNEQRRFLEFESGYTDALAEAFAARTALQRAVGVDR